MLAMVHDDGSSVPYSYYNITLLQKFNNCSSTRLTRVHTHTYVHTYQHGSSSSLRMLFMFTTTPVSNGMNENQLASRGGAGTMVSWRLPRQTRVTAIFAGALFFKQYHTKTAPTLNLLFGRESRWSIILSFCDKKGIVSTQRCCHYSAFRFVRQSLSFCPGRCECHPLK